MGYVQNSRLGCNNTSSFQTPTEILFVCLPVYLFFCLSAHVCLLDNLSSDSDKVYVDYLARSILNVKHVTDIPCKYIYFIDIYKRMFYIIPVYIILYIY